MSIEKFQNDLTVWFLGLSIFLITALAIIGVWKVAELAVLDKKVDMRGYGHRASEIKP